MQPLSSWSNELFVIPDHTIINMEKQKLLEEPHNHHATPPSRHFKKYDNRTNHLNTLEKNLILQVCFDWLLTKDGSALAVTCKKFHHILCEFENPFQWLHEIRKCNIKLEKILQNHSTLFQKDLKGNCLFPETEEQLIHKIHRLIHERTEYSLSLEKKLSKKKADKNKEQGKKQKLIGRQFLTRELIPLTEKCDALDIKLRENIPFLLAHYMTKNRTVLLPNETNLALKGLRKWSNIKSHLPGLTFCSFLNSLGKSRIFIASLTAVSIVGLTVGLVHWHHAYPDIEQIFQEEVVVFLGHKNLDYTGTRSYWDFIMNNDKIWQHPFFKVCGIRENHFNFEPDFSKHVKEVMNSVNLSSVGLYQDYNGKDEGTMMNVSQWLNQTIITPCAANTSFIQNQLLSFVKEYISRNFRYTVSKWLCLMNADNVTNTCIAMYFGEYFTDIGIYSINGNSTLAAQAAVDVAVNDWEYTGNLIKGFGGFSCFIPLLWMFFSFLVTYF